MYLNENFKKLSQNYLFREITDRVDNFRTDNPGKKIINLGVGDYTLPLCPTVVDSMKKAVDEQSKKETFKGYGPEEGYLFLREKISDYYKTKSVNISADEIFISDGANSDIGNVLDLFSSDNTVIIPDPVYPAYVDANIIDGRNIIYVNANKYNSFLPDVPDKKFESSIMYICSPNNPTGATYDFIKLKRWVDYALETESVIVFDAAYEAFIRDTSLPSTIFSIPGAKRCAIEICSFSKIAGFTGVRCGYTVICKDLEFSGTVLNKIYKRRLVARFNGVSYITQVGASAVFTENGMKEIKKNLDYYKQNACLLSSALKQKGIFYTGADNSPYVWFQCPYSMKSWEFFDYLLNNFEIVGTPGVGFGKNGEGFFRLSSFGTKEETEVAAEKILKL